MGTHCQLGGGLPSSGYKSVNIPEAMYEEIRQIVKENPSHYSSISEFVKSALRVEMRQYEVHTEE